MTDKQIKKWDTINKREIDNFKIFDLSWVRRKHPDNGKEGEFVVLNSAEWVNIIPVTQDKKIVLIEQYRQGTDELTIEVPGGLVEAGEEPRDAGERECREETGYEGNGKSLLLGVNTPNPAFLNNKCYSYVWFGCELKYEQKLDRHEDIRVIEVPADDIKVMILEGKIRHSLVLTAFFFYTLKYGLFVTT
ncbi:MAG: NUDIX hydrolase [Ignavibacteriae bacterium]|nr:NUDIX hydrolase [Ignavibacteriota bacterium]